MDKACQRPLGAQGLLNTQEALSLYPLLPLPETLLCVVPPVCLPVSTGNGEPPMGTPTQPNVVLDLLPPLTAFFLSQIPAQGLPKSIA
jgi:hypothetical protein